MLSSLYTPGPPGYVSSQSTQGAQESQLPHPMCTVRAALTVPAPGTLFQVWPPPGPGLAALCLHSLVARSSPSHLQVLPCLTVSRRATGESLNLTKHQEPPEVSEQIDTCGPSAPGM